MIAFAKKNLSLYKDAINAGNFEKFDELYSQGIPFEEYWKKLLTGKINNIYSQFSANPKPYKEVYVEYLNQKPSVLNMICFYSGQSKNLLEFLQQFFLKYPSIEFNNNTPSIIKIDNLNLISLFKCQDRYILLKNLFNKKYQRCQRKKLLNVAKQYIETFFKGEEEKCILNLFMTNFANKGIKDVSFAVSHDLFNIFHPKGFINNNNIDTYYYSLKFFQRIPNMLGDVEDLPFFLYVVTFSSDEKYNWFIKNNKYFKEGFNWLKNNPNYMLHCSKHKRVKSLCKKMNVDFHGLKDQKNNNYIFYFFRYFLYSTNMKYNLKLLKEIVEDNFNFIKNTNILGIGFKELVFQHHKNSSKYAPYDINYYLSFYENLSFKFNPLLNLNNIKSGQKIL